MTVIYFFVGIDRKPSDLVKRRLEQEPSRKEGLVSLLGSKAIEDVYIAFDKSPEDETDELPSELHDYLTALLRDEYSSPSGSLTYSMSLANNYILGFEVNEDGRQHGAEISASNCESACQQAADELQVPVREVKLYALTH